MQLLMQFFYSKPEVDLVDPDVMDVNYDMEVNREIEITFLVFVTLLLYRLLTVHLVFFTQILI